MSAHDNHELRGTVLCVDDEPNILSALKRLLRPHGYEVLVEQDTQAALALLGRGRSE